LFGANPAASSADMPTLLESIIDSSNDAIISVTLTGIITSWNRGAERIYGYRAQEIMGQNVSLVADPDRTDEALDLLDRIRNGERIDHYQTTRLRKDGAKISVSVTLSAIRDANGIVVGASSAARDITEREHAQDLVRIASLYARSLLEASPDPLVTISPEGKITDVNEATIRVTGVEREGLIGTDFLDYFTEPDEARRGYEQVFAKGFVTDYPLTIRHIDGRLTDVLYNASAYKDTAGTVLGVFAAARDVTAQKRAEADLAEQRIKDMDRLLELERFQRLTVGRELRMIELKKENEQLNEELTAMRARSDMS
jgi:PAS domain S-box-containing protein